MNFDLQQKQPVYGPRNKDNVRVLAPEYTVTANRSTLLEASLPIVSKCNNYAYAMGNHIHI